MFWKRRPSGQVRVFVWDSCLKKQVALPRANTKHLDLLSDFAIDQWILRQTALDKIVCIRPDLIGPPKPISEVVDKFCLYLKQQERAHITVWSHRRNILSYCLPYFHTVHKVECLQDYISHSRNLYTWLSETIQLPDSKIVYVQMSLRVFWQWLVEEGLVQAGPLILKRVKRKNKGTPLKRLLSPEDILGWQAPRPDLKLMALLGYFFSLRTQETFGLMRTDFVAGERATELESGRVMAVAGLYNRLALRVVRQRGKEGYSSPKKHSTGVVSCFDERAARAIIQLVNEMRRPIFPLSPNHYVKLWAVQGIANVTIKELRRASLYWLGHYTKLDIVALKNHARHREITTTALYTRRPDALFTEQSGDLIL